MNSMATNPPHALQFAMQVERFYAGLILAAKPGSDTEPSLGGRLLYAGQLGADARALLVAANIAGAASLAVSADAAAGKQAMRDGVIDFLVTSLDEALRILKNEMRKRTAVAVCVVQDSEADFARLLLERGVLPDAQVIAQIAHGVHVSARRIQNFGNHAVQRGAIGADLALEFKPLAHAHNRHAVVADGSRDNHRVAVSCSFWTDLGV